MEIMIRASKGMWLTDGENYGKTISLAKGVSVDNYYEITDEEYEKILEEQKEAYEHDEKIVYQGCEDDIPVEEVL